MSPTYATSEESRQAGAPLELYRIKVGARRGRPASPPSSGVVEVFRDEFDTNDGWVFDGRGMAILYKKTPIACTISQCAGSAGCIAGGVCPGVMTLSVSSAYKDGCSDCLPPGGNDGIGFYDSQHSGPLWRRVITGLLPNTWHNLTVDLTIDASFATDPFVDLYDLIGLATDPGGSRTVIATAYGLNPRTIAGTTVSATASGKSTSAGTLTVFMGWGFRGYFSVGSNHSMAWDNLVITRPEVLEGDPGEDPSDGVLSHFTSADVDVVYAGDTYASGIMVRNNLVAGGNESNAGSIELKVPRTHALAALAGGPPNPPVTLELIRLHRADLTQAVTAWRGQVVRRRFQGADCVLVCAGLGSLFDRKLPRRRTQKMCHHIVGDALCQVRLADFTTGLLTVSAIDGNVVTVDGAAAAATLSDSQWVNGVLTFGMIKGRIEGFSAAAGDQITLRQEIPGLIVGSQVTLTAGCDNQIGTCKTVFDNTIHYGGERVLPVHNPGTGAGIGASGGNA